MALVLRLWWGQLVVETAWAMLQCLQHVSTVQDVPAQTVLLSQCE